MNREEWTDYIKCLIAGLVRSECHSVGWRTMTVSPDIFYFCCLIDVENILQCCVSIWYTDVIQFYTYIYIFFFRFFSILDYYKILNIVPCAIW